MEISGHNVIFFAGFVGSASVFTLTTASMMLRTIGNVHEANLNPSELI